MLQYTHFSWTPYINPCACLWLCFLFGSVSVLFLCSTLCTCLFVHQSVGLIACGFVSKNGSPASNSHQKLPSNSSRSPKSALLPFLSWGKIPLLHFYPVQPMPVSHGQQISPKVRHREIPGGGRGWLARYLEEAASGRVVPRQTGVCLL